MEVHRALLQLPHQLIFYCSALKSLNLLLSLLFHKPTQGNPSQTDFRLFHYQFLQDIGLNHLNWLKFRASPSQPQLKPRLCYKFKITSIGFVDLQQNWELAHNLLHYNHHQIKQLHQSM